MNSMKEILDFIEATEARDDLTVEQKTELIKSMNFPQMPAIADDPFIGGYNGTN